MWMRGRERRKKRSGEIYMCVVYGLGTYRLRIWAIVWWARAQPITRRRCLALVLSWRLTSNLARDTGTVRARYMATCKANPCAKHWVGSNTHFAIRDAEAGSPCWRKNRGTARLACNSMKAMLPYFTRREMFRDAAVQHIKTIFSSDYTVMPPGHCCHCAPVVQVM